MEIKELLIKDYDTIQSDDTVRDAVSMFSSDKRPRTLLVFDEGGNYIGVVTERIIFRSGSQSENTKIKKLTVKAPQLSKEDSIYDVARLMLDSNMKHLPVFEGKTILGIVTSIDILKAAMKSTNIGKMNIRKFMTSSPRVVSEDDKIATVITLFKEAQISRVPVLKGGIPTGVVSKHDIVTKLMVQNNTFNFEEFEPEKHTLLNNSVTDIMNYPLDALHPEDSVKSAIEMMAEKKINSVLVIDTHEHLKGILTKKDLLEPIAAISKDSEQKRFIQVRGQKVENFDRSYIHNEFEKMMSKFENHLGESHAFVYVKKHIGRLNKGKMRGVDLYYLRARISTDLGTFVASSEEYGLMQTTNELVRLLDKQISNHLERLSQRSSSMASV